MARSLYSNVSLGKNTNNSGQFSEYIRFEQAGAELGHTRGLKDLFNISLKGIDSISFYPINDIGANSGLKLLIPQGNF